MRWSKNSITSDIYPIIGIVVFVGAIVAWARWDISISRGILAEWSAKEGLEILKSSHRSLVRGPFTWNSQKSDAVFFVTARTSDGQIRRGWVRVGRNAWSGADTKWIS